MGSAYSEDNADLSSTHAISIFHMIGESTTISSWHNKDYLIGWTDF